MSVRFFAPLLATLLVGATACEPEVPPEIPHLPAGPQPPVVVTRSGAFCSGGTLVTGRTKSYCLVMEDVSWTHALEGCASRGGRLAIIDDAYENDALIGGLSVESPDLRVWVALSDAEQEGDWRWINGEPPFANWRPGEPNDLGGEDCAEWVLPGGGFNDLACTTPHAYLCEARTAAVAR